MTIGIEYDPKCYDWWQADQNGLKPKPVQGEPHTGFFRDRSFNGKSDDPVRFFYDGDNPVCLLGGARIIDEATAMVEGAIVLNGDKVRNKWDSVNQRSVSEAEYRERVKLGRWANDPEPVAGEEDRPADLSPLERCKWELRRLNKQMQAYLVVNDDTKRDQALTVRASLLGCKASFVDGLEDAAKPHLPGYNAYRQLMGIWNKYAREAEDNAKVLAAAVSRYEGEKLRRNRAAEAEAAKLAEKQAAAAAAQAAGVDNPRAVIGGNQPPPPPVQPQARPQPPSQLRGAVGRAVSVKERWEADFTGWDQDAVYAFYRSNDKVQNVLKAVAQYDIARGIEVPGVKRREGVGIR